MGIQVEPVALAFTTVKRVRLKNVGNVRSTLSLSAPPQFSVTPATLALAPGATATAVIALRDAGSAGNLVVRDGSQELQRVPIAYVEEEQREGASEKAALLEAENERLSSLVAELRSGVPSVNNLLDIYMRREREQFEANSRQALEALRAKDATIAALTTQLAEEKSRRSETATSTSTLMPAAAAAAAAADPAAAAATAASAEVAKLREELSDKSEQLEIFVAEVARLRRSEATDAPGSTATAENVTHVNSSAAAALLRAKELEKANENLQASLKDAQRSLSEQTTRFQRIVADLRNDSSNRRAGYAARPADDVDHSEVSRFAANGPETSTSISGAAAAAVAERKLLAERAAREEDRRMFVLRETELLERVERLESLKERARGLALESEATLEQTVSQLRAHAAAAAAAGGPTNSAAAAAAAASIGLLPGAVGSDAESSGGEYDGTSSQKHKRKPDAETEFLRAQAWWLHVVNAERRGTSAATANDSAAAADARTPSAAELDQLRNSLREQAVELVLLRQRAIEADAKRRRAEAAAEERLAAAAARALHLDADVSTARLANATRIAELRRTVDSLRGSGDPAAVAAAAREELSGERVALVRMRGEANMYRQLLAEEQQRQRRQRRRAETAEAALERQAVAETVQNVPGGVSPLSVLEQFAGTARKHVERISALEKRLKAAERAKNRRRWRQSSAGVVNSRSGAKGDLEVEDEAEDTSLLSDSGGEGPSSSAAVANAELKRLTARCKALEAEIEHVRQAQVAAAAAASSSVRQSDEQTKLELAAAEETARATKRQLAAAQEEVEALRSANRDLRAEVDRLSCEISEVSLSGGPQRNRDASESISAPAHDGEAAYDAWERGMPGDFGVPGVSSKSNALSNKPASPEIERLCSLLEERDAQVQVLRAAVEALHTAAALSGAAAGTGSHTTGAASDSRVAEPGQAGRSSNAAAAAAGVPWASDLGIRSLSRVSARGLVKHCIATSTALCNAISRAGAAERRANRLSREAGAASRSISNLQAQLDEVKEAARAAAVRRRQAAAAAAASRAEADKLLADRADEAAGLRLASAEAAAAAEDAERKMRRCERAAAALRDQIASMTAAHREELGRMGESYELRLRAAAEHAFANAPRTDGTSSGGGLNPVYFSPIGTAIDALLRDLLAVGQSVQAEERLRNGRNGRGNGDSAASAVATDGGATWRRRVATYLREVVCKLDTESTSAVRRASAAEWEARQLRGELLDAKCTLGEETEARKRLETRLRATEAALDAHKDGCGRLTRLDVSAAAGMFAVNGDMSRQQLPPSPSNEDRPSARDDRNGNSSALVLPWTSAPRFGLDPAATGAGAVSQRVLLEQQLTVVMRRLIDAASGCAAASAEASAYKSEVERMQTQLLVASAEADALRSELGRREAESTLASDVAELLPPGLPAARRNGVISQSSELQPRAGINSNSGVPEWQRQLRGELRAWWEQELLPLLDGVKLTWPDELRDEGQSHTASSAAGEGAEMAELGSPAAMAAALVVSRAEQANLEGRLAAANLAADDARKEVGWLRDVLSGWYRRFVAPHRSETTSRPQQLQVEDPATARRGTLSRNARRAATSAASAAAAAERLERKAAHADRVAAEALATAANAESEVRALHELNVRLRTDEARARAGLDTRLAAAAAGVRRRCEAEIAAAKEAVTAERDRFKRDVAELTARLASQGAELSDLTARNAQLEALAIDHAVLGASDPIAAHMRGSSSGRAAATTSQDILHDSAIYEATAASAGAALDSLRVEKRKLQDMCNGLAVDLRKEAEATLAAERECDRLVDLAANARAEVTRLSSALDVQSAALRAMAATLRQVEARQGGMPLMESAMESLNANGVNAASSLSGLQSSSHALHDSGDPAAAAAAARSQARNRDSGNTATNNELGGGGTENAPEQAAARAFALEDSHGAAGASIGMALAAAKLAVADLQRRLAAGGSVEVELRKLLERRDKRIDELRKELGALKGTARGRTPLAADNAGSASSAGSVVRNLVGERGDTAADGVYDAGDDNGADSSVSALRRRVSDQLVAIRQLELRLAELVAAGAGSAAAAASAERVASAAFGYRASQFSANANTVGSQRPDECPNCGRLQQQLDESEARRLTAESAADEFMAKARRSWSSIGTAGGVAAVAFGQPADGGGNHSLGAASFSGRFPPSLTELENQRQNRDVKAGGERVKRPRRAATEVEGAAEWTEGDKANSLDSPPEQRPRRARDDSFEDADLLQSNGARDIQVGSEGRTARLLSKDVDALQTQVLQLERVLSGLAASAKQSSAAGNAAAAAAAPSRRERRDSFDSDSEYVGNSNRAPTSAGLPAAVTHLLAGMRPRLADLRRRAAAAEGFEAEVLSLRTELVRRQRAYFTAVATLRDRYDAAVAAAQQQHQLQQGPGAAGNQQERSAGAAAASQASSRVDAQQSEGSAGQPKATKNADTPTPNATSSKPAAVLFAPAESERLRTDLAKTKASARALSEELKAAKTALSTAEANCAAAAAEAATQLRALKEAHRRALGAAEQQLKAARKAAFKRPRVSSTRSFRALPATTTPNSNSIQTGSLAHDELSAALAESDARLLEARQRLAKLQLDHRLKCEELAGAVSAAASAGDNVPAAAAAAPPSGAAAGFRCAALAARAAAAESEAQRLSTELARKEQDSLETNRELSALKLRVNRAAFVGAAQSSKEALKQLSAAKGATVAEAARLRERLAQIESSRPTRAELDDCKAQLRSALAAAAAAKEESSRRGKAVAAARASKAAEEGGAAATVLSMAALEGRLAQALRDVESKSALIRDLRAKKSELESRLAELEAVAASHASGNSSGKDAKQQAAALDGKAGDVGVPLRTENNGSAAGNEAVTTAAGAAVSGASDAQEVSALKEQVRTLRQQLSEAKSAASGARERAEELSKSRNEVLASEARLKTARAALVAKEAALKAAKARADALSTELEGLKTAHEGCEAARQNLEAEAKRLRKSVEERASASAEAVAAAERLMALRTAVRSTLEGLYDAAVARARATAQLRERNVAGAASMATGGANLNASAAARSNAESTGMISAMLDISEAEVKDILSSGSSSAGGAQPAASAAATAAAAATARDERFAFMAQASGALDAVDGAALAGLFHTVRDMELQEVSAFNASADGAASLPLHGTAPRRFPAVAERGLTREQERQQQQRQQQQQVPIHAGAGASSQHSLRGSLSSSAALPQSATALPPPLPPAAVANIAASAALAASSSANADHVSDESTVQMHVPRALAAQAGASQTGVEGFGSSALQELLGLLSAPRAELNEARRLTPPLAPAALDPPNQLSVGPPAEATAT